MESNLDCVYGFIYTECTYDSNYRTISVHRTKKGAYNEMRTFLIKQYLDWYNDRITYGKYAGDRWCGENERWSIHTIKLKE